MKKKRQIKTDIKDISKIWGIGLLIALLSISLAFAFKESFQTEWLNQTSCRESLGLRSLGDSFKITLPAGDYLNGNFHCKDVVAELSVENIDFCHWVNLGDILKKTSQSANPDYNSVCVISLKQLFDASCCKDDKWGVCTPRGEPTNKKWSLRLGYNDQGVSVYNASFKVVSSDDLTNQCEELAKHNKGLWIGIPLTILCFICAIFTGKKYKPLSIVGIVVGALSSILGYMGWF